MTRNPAATYVCKALSVLFVLAWSINPAAGQDEPQPQNDSAGTDQARIAFKDLPAIEKPTNPDKPAPMHPQAAKAYQEGIEALEKADYLGGVNQFERAMGFNPKNPRIRRALAMSYAGLKNLGKAYEHVEQAVKLAGNDLEAQVLYGKLAEQRRDYDTAIKAYRTALLTDEAKPSNPRAAFALLHLAETLQRKGYHQASLDCYNRMADWLSEHATEYTSIDELKELAIRPQRLYLRQGLLLMQLDRPEQAVGPLRRTWQRDRSNPIAAKLLVGALVESKQAEQAAELLVEMAGEPNLKESVAQLAGAVVVANKKQTDLAVKIWDQAARAEAADEALAMALAQGAWQGGNNQTAIRVLESAVKANPSPRLGRTLTEAYIRDGQVIQAAQGLAELLAESPAADPSVRNAIVALAQKPMPEDILDSLTAAADKAESPSAAYYVAGRLAQQLDKPDRAGTFFEKSAQADKQFLPAWEAIVEVYLETRQYDKADTALKALQDGDNPTVAYLRGKVMLRRGQARQARELLESVQNKLPRDVQLRRTLARAYERTGQEYDAYNQLTEAAGLAPRDAEVWGELIDMLIRQHRTSQAMVTANTFIQRVGSDNASAQILQARAAVAQARLDAAQARAYHGSSAEAQHHAAQARRNMQLAATLTESLKASAGDQTDVKLLDIQLQIAQKPGMLSKSDWDAIVAQLNEIAFRDPDNVAAQQLLARLLKDHAKHATAAAVYKQLAQLTFQRPDVMISQIELLIWLDRCDEAMEVARAVLENDPSDYTAKRLLVDAANLAGKHELAVEHIQSWLEKAEKSVQSLPDKPGGDPFTAWYHAVLVETYSRAESYDKAIDALDKWIATGTDDDESKKYRKIRLLVQAGQKEKAIAFASDWIGQIEKQIAALPQGDNQVASLTSRRDMVRRMLAYNLSEEKEYDAAVKLLDEWIGQKTDATFEGYRLMKLMFLDQAGRIDQVRKYALDWIEQSPTALAPRQALVDALIGAEQYDQARKLAEGWIEQLDGIIRTNPLLAQPAKVTRDWCIRGVAIVEMGRKDWNAAIKWIEKHLKDRSEQEQLLSLLSSSYGEKGDIDQQMKLLEELIEMRPDDPLYNNNLGYFLAEQGKDLARAEKLIRISLRANPEAVSTIDSLGWVYYKQGRFGRAGEIFLSLVEMGKAFDTENPDENPMVHPIIYTHAGDTFWQLGWKDLAVETWKHAVKIIDRVAENSSDLEFVKTQTPARIKAAESGGQPELAPYDKTFKPAEAEPEAADEGEIEIRF